MIAEVYSTAQIDDKRSLGVGNPVQRKVIVLAVFWLIPFGVFGLRNLRAEQHVVSSDELRQHIQTTHETREGDLRDVRRFFSSTAVEESLRGARLDAAKIKDVAPLLDDTELARLAQRTRSIESDVTAGALTNQQLTYIVIALGTAIVVILAS